MILQSFHSLNKKLVVYLLSTKRHSYDHPNVKTQGSSKTFLLWNYHLFSHLHDFLNILFQFLPWTCQSQRDENLWYWKIVKGSRFVIYVVDHVKRTWEIIWPWYHDGSTNSFLLWYAKVNKKRHKNLASFSAKEHRSGDIWKSVSPQVSSCHLFQRVFTVYILFDKNWQPWRVLQKVLSWLIGEILHMYSVACTSIALRFSLDIHVTFQGLGSCLLCLRLNLRAQKIPKLLWENESDGATYHFMIYQV